MSMGLLLLSLVLSSVILVLSLSLSLSLQQSEINGSRKKSVAPESGTSFSDQICPINETPKESSARIKSVGGIENFQQACMVVCRTLFDSCMQVMWNGVFYTPVAEYCCTWRKRKRWSGQAVLFRDNVEKSEKLIDERVSC